MSNPAPGGAFGLTDDERNRSELLFHVEEQLKRSLESAPVPLHWIGPGGIIEWVNTAELKLLGYGRDEYVGRPIADFHVDPIRAADLVARLAGGEVLRNFPAEMRAKSGEVKQVLIDSAPPSGLPGFTHAQCFTRDVTERLRVENSSRRLAAIVESSEDAIIAKNLRGIIMTWNNSAERIFGYTAEEAIGKSITILIPADRVDEEAGILSLIRRGKRVEHYETVRRRKNGSLVDISLTVSPVRDTEGRVIGASKIARDISARKRSEEQLRAAKDLLARLNSDLEARVTERTASLREAVAQMEEFSYTVSHDLRAPARAMKCYAQIIIADFGEDLDPLVRDYLERIIRGGERMDRLIQDVLTYSRLSRRDLELQPISLDKIVADIIAQYPELQPPRARVTVHSPLAAVLGHEPSLAQAISNLLNNGAKFVPHGETPRITIRTELRGATVRLWIEDNGIGVKPEHRRRIFGIFERLPAAAEYEGTGIGLAIVRKAVEKMGGSVGVESDGLTGSQFWIELPGI